MAQSVRSTAGPGPLARGVRSELATAEILAPNSGPDTRSRHGARRGGVLERDNDRAWSARCHSGMGPGGLDDVASRLARPARAFSGGRRNLLAVSIARWIGA